MNEENEDEEVEKGVGGEGWRRQECLCRSGGGE